MEQAQAPRRRSDRSKVLLSASLQLKDRMVAVMLRNLSEHGALVELCGFVSEAEEVMFRRDDLCAAGHVAWVRGKQVGIAFAKPLKREAILRHFAAAGGPKMPRPPFRRPGVRKHELSTQEQRLMEMLDPADLPSIPK